MKKILVATLLVMVSGVLLSQAAFAYDGSLTLQQQLAKDAVKMASLNKGAGSGTPYFAADGVLGASAIAAAIFGGIATTFFVMGKHGRYVAQGRG